MKFPFRLRKQKSMDAVAYKTHHAQSEMSEVEEQRVAFAKAEEALHAEQMQLWMEQAELKRKMASYQQDVRLLEEERRSFEKQMEDLKAQMHLLRGRMEEFRQLTDQRNTISDNVRCCICDEFVSVQCLSEYCQHTTCSACGTRYMSFCHESDDFPLRCMALAEQFCSSVLSPDRLVKLQATCSEDLTIPQAILSEIISRQQSHVSHCK